MVYTMRIALFACLASFVSVYTIPVTATEQNMSALKGIRLVTAGMSVDCLVSTDREKQVSFFNGASSVAFGMVAGYFLGLPIEHEYVGTALGVFGAAIIDHCCLGGKEDKNQIARKSGNFVLPIIVAGGMIYYPYHTGAKKFVNHGDDLDTLG